MIWSSGWDCCVHLHILKLVIFFFSAISLGYCIKYVNKCYIQYHNFENSQEKYSCFVVLELIKLMMSGLISLNVLLGKTHSSLGIKKLHELCKKSYPAVSP